MERIGAKKFKKKQIAVYCLMWMLFGVTSAVNNISFYMVEAILLFIYIFWRARISFFVELSFILVFSLFQTWVQATTGNAYGMIENNQAGTPLYESEHAICTMVFLLTLIFFIEFTMLIENEKKLYSNTLQIDLYIGVIFMIVSIILVIMLFPSVPTFRVIPGMRRTQGISATYGWIVVALLLASLTYDLSYKYKWFWIGYIFIIFWVLGHGERVEILGFISYIMLKSFNKNNMEEQLTKAERFKRILKIIGVVFGIAIFLLFLVWLGLYREKGGTYSLTYLIRKLFVQATAGDVVYVFDCAVDMWKNNNLTHGITYLDYFLQLIPSGPNQYSVGTYIKNFYYTVGGALFFTEPMMNFGMFGVIITNITFCLFYYWVSRKANAFRLMFWIPFVIEIFRTAWYGRAGWVLSAFVEVPLLYLGLHLLSERKRLLGKVRKLIFNHLQE